MYLVELFLPVTDNDGRRFDDTLFATIREELTDRFGGVTVFSRAPAKGVTAEGGEPVHDDIIVMEVMADELDRGWWKNYRKQLEQKLKQDEILIRATQIEKL